MVTLNSIASTSNQNASLKNVHLFHQRSKLFLSNKVKNIAKRRINKPRVSYGRRQQPNYGQIWAAHYVIVAHQGRQVLEDERAASSPTPKSPHRRKKCVRLNVGAALATTTNDCQRMYHKSTPNKKDTHVKNKKRKK